MTIKDLVTGFFPVFIIFFILFFLFHLPSMLKEKKINRTCNTCKREKDSTKPRIANSLPAGKHCDKCWDNIKNCHKQIW